MPGVLVEKSSVYLVGGYFIYRKTDIFEFDIF